MNKHVEYWQPHLQSGTALVIGLVADPKGGYGVGIVQVDDQHQLNDLIANDPANGLHVYEVHPIRAMSKLIIGQYNQLSMNTYSYNYPHFALTVDAVIFSKSDAGLDVLLIFRANEPFKDHWAFCGGYVDIDELIEDAVYRELKEETSITNISLTRFDIFDAIDRDPRERTASVVYYGFIDGSIVPIKAGDDAKEVKWFPVNKLPELAFDHSIILKKILEVVEK